MSLSQNTAFFRFHGELEDFLTPHQRGKELAHAFRDQPGIKDPIERLGVPHSEIALIEVNGEAVDYKYKLKPGDQVDAYPLTSNRAHKIAQSMFDGRPRFVVDTNLGKLARWLRLLGFDTCWRNDYADSEVVRVGVEKRRIILTRDRRLLFHKVIMHGFWVRAVIPGEQVQEVVQRLGLADHVHPFHRCLECNGLIQPVEKSVIVNQLEPLTRKYYEEFYQCRQCRQIYWKGSHYSNLIQRLEQLEPHA